jgi:hypothetical protein
MVGFALLVVQFFVKVSVGWLVGVWRLVDWLVGWLVG